jgi:hypothetical protein
LDQGDVDMTSGGVVFFASLSATIFSTIAHTSLIRPPPLMQVFQFVDEHTTAAPIGDANEDGDSGISHDAEGSAAEHEY